MAEIKCRAQVHDDCYDRRDDSEIYPDDDTQESDGTWDGETTVCDVCLLKVEPFASDLDRPFLHRAIEHYRVNLRYVREQDDEKLPELIEEARARLKSATVGSPAWNSADACSRMVEDEMERRQEA